MVTRAVLDRAKMVGIERSAIVEPAHRLEESTARDRKRRTHRLTAWPRRMLGRDEGGNAEPALPRKTLAARGWSSNLNVEILLMTGRKMLMWRHKKMFLPISRMKTPKRADRGFRAALAD